jgi:MFS family permease
MGLLGTSCMFSPIVTYVSRWFDRRRGAAVALISSGQSISGAVWPVVLQAGIDDWGWRRTMLAFGLFVIVAIVLLAVLFLSPAPVAPPARDASWAKGSRATLAELPPNLAMVLLMLAVFCCCVPMSMPMAHVAAFCGDLGFSPQHGAAMLSVLLGSAFLSRQFWGWLADQAGGLQTLFWSSLAQVLALSSFLLTRNEVALFAVASAFGLGLSGLLPAYVITVREYFPVAEAGWRVPAVLAAGFVGMAAGGWGAGVLYDCFGYYLPAFGVGIAFNLVNLLVLVTLLARQSRWEHALGL